MKDKALPLGENTFILTAKKKKKSWSERKKLIRGKKGFDNLKLNQLFRAVVWLETVKTELQNFKINVLLEIQPTMFTSDCDNTIRFFLWATALNKGERALKLEKTVGNWMGFVHHKQANSSVIKISVDFSFFSVLILNRLEKSHH